MAPNSKNIMKKGIYVERIIITWKYLRIIITTTTTTTKTDKTKVIKETFSEGPKPPPKYVEKQTIFPSAKYQRTVDPPSN